MASLYRKKNSPYWFVQFIDSNGKRRNKSTELRTDNPGETTQARALRAQFEAKELMRTGAVEGDGWDTWVPQFLERYCETARTREHYIDAWKWLALWLQLRKLHTPGRLPRGTPVETAQLAALGISCGCSVGCRVCSQSSPQRRG